MVEPSNFALPKEESGDSGSTESESEASGAVRVVWRASNSVHFCGSVF